MYAKIHPYRFFMAFNWSFAVLLTCLIAMLPPTLEPTPVQLLTQIFPAPVAVALLTAGIHSTAKRRSRKTNYGLMAVCGLLGLWAAVYVANHF
ncbi:hypothetical protein [Noviherbaspirillum malthae]|uniref:hypothetical protein n=1 Tax=Noviherbaspirillum malthae TaxID=1260987 RepID=UPI00188EF7A7|nr:hypothetical protein [Noviherbaspirillum malthae]